MHMRELTPEEWPAFFDAFSRRYQGRPVSVSLVSQDSDRRPTRSAVARRLPLMGVTAERRQGRVEAIEMILGDSPDAHLMHVVREPARVKVGQISNGEDETLLIEPRSGPATELDFRTPPPRSSDLEANQRGG